MRFCTSIFKIHCFSLRPNFQDEEFKTNLCGYQLWHLNGLGTKEISEFYKTICYMIVCEMQDMEVLVEGRENGHEGALCATPGDGGQHPMQRARQFLGSSPVFPPADLASPLVQQTMAPCASGTPPATEEPHMGSHGRYEERGGGDEVQPRGEAAAGVGGPNREIPWD